MSEQNHFIKENLLKDSEQRFKQISMLYNMSLSRKKQLKQIRSFLAGFLIFSFIVLLLFKNLIYFIFCLASFGVYQYTKAMYDKESEYAKSLEKDFHYLEKETYLINTFVNVVQNIVNPQFNINSSTNDIKYILEEKMTSIKDPELKAQVYAQLQKAVASFNTILDGKDKTLIEKSAKEFEAILLSLIVLIDNSQEQLSQKAAIDLKIQQKLLKS